MGGNRCCSRFLVVAGLALPATLCAAHEVSWDDRGGAALRVQVLPGRTLEWCGTLRAGDDVHWEFESADPLEMNVHFHEGPVIAFPVEPALAAARSGRLAPPAEQDYCWTWTNPGGVPVALQARLQKAAKGR